MYQVNMFEAKTDLSKLVKKLETGEEKAVIIARNGHPIAQMTLIPPETPEKRIGAAKGKFTVPDDFDNWDHDIEDLFEEYI